MTKVNIKNRIKIEKKLVKGITGKAYEAFDITFEGRNTPELYSNLHDASVALTEYIVSQEDWASDVWNDFQKSILEVNASCIATSILEEVTDDEL
jgi:hypothetical protein